MKLPKSKYEQTKLWDLPLVKEMKCVQDLFSIVSIDESGVFADHGYVRSNGGRFVDIYDGKVENIPEEYRIKSPKLYERAVVGRTEKDMER